MRISDLKKSIKEMIVAELTIINKDTKIQDVPGVDSNTLKVAVEKSKETGKPVSIAEDNLTEMAKIAGDLATAIKSVINDNPDMDTLSLKKAIKSDPAVIAALDGESLFDNQLSRFISLSTGERELGQRGRKVDLGNTLAKKMAELEAQEQSLMNKLNKISQLKKELESSLGINKVDESQVNEMAKIAGDLASAIKKVVDSNSDLEGLALKKAIKADAAVKSALAGDELYDNQLNKHIAFLKGEREIGQRGRKADPNVAAKRSEEEKAKEEKRAEKEKARAEKERAKAPAQKPSFPAYKKTTTMVDMSGEPSDKDIAKAEKELGIDIPKVTKPSKLSAEEKDKFDIALKGITAKVNRIKNKEAKADDIELLKKAYGNADIKKLFKKAGKDLDDLVAGIITTKKDKFDDIESDEL
jgi:phage gp37-like protein